MKHVLHALGPALHPWGYVIVFAAVMLEASAFIGLVIPGETALLLGGFLAQQHRLALWLVIVLGVTGAVLGDSIGYEVGRHLGDRLRQTRLGRKVGDERWERARQTLRSHGGRAVLIGRWVGVLRALVPAAAGDSGLPYRTFLAWNVAGAVVWAPAVVLLGYIAGNAYETVDKILGWGTLGLLAVGVASWYAVTRARSRRERARAARGTRHRSADLGKTPRV